MIDLDCPDDPAWLYLNIQSQWIKTQLRNGYLEMGQIFSDKSFSSDAKVDDSKSRKTGEGGTLDFASDDHVAKKFVYTSCHVVRERIGSTWKMAKRILEGKFKRVILRNCLLSIDWSCRNLLQSLLLTRNLSMKRSKVVLLPFSSLFVNILNRSYSMERIIPRIFSSFLHAEKTFANC